MTNTKQQDQNKTEVTFSPAWVSEFPYFCLSRKPEHLNRDIEWLGTDSEGRLMTWNVRPNSNGLPGEAAWVIWLTIIQPLLHAHQPLRHGMLIPLGRVADCLRALDWYISGANGKVLTRSINQIAGATIEFDIWLPLPQTGPRGETHRRVSGRGPRILVYSIGEYQVTEADLQSGMVPDINDFNDVISIRVALEADLQQNIQYRPLDQAYVRSVKPSARRWYELTAAAVYGAVSHPKSPGFFDIRYSWYVTRHHTLEPQTGLRRIRMQMEKIIADHLKSGYLQKASYFETPDGTDVVIRYYPGDGAKQSINRIKSKLAGKKGRLPVDVPSDSGDELLSGTDHYVEELAQRLINEFGVIQKVAWQLAEAAPEEVRKQVDAYPLRKTKPANPAAFIVQSIRERWPLPQGHKAPLSVKEQKPPVQMQSEANEMAGGLQERCEDLQRAAQGLSSLGMQELSDVCHYTQREIAILRARIVKEDGYRLDDVNSVLSVADDNLANALLQSAGSDDLDQFFISAKNSLREYEEKMGEEDFAATVQRLVVKALREKYGIPNLSSFYL